MNHPYLAIIAALLRKRYDLDWRNYATEAQIKRHESEGWDAEKFVDYIAMKFNLDRETA